MVEYCIISCQLLFNVVTTVHPLNDINKILTAEMASQSKHIVNTYVSGLQYINAHKANIDTITNTSVIV